MKEDKKLSNGTKIKIETSSFQQSIKGSEGDYIVKEEEHPCWELLVHKDYGSVELTVKEYKKSPEEMDVAVLKAMCKDILAVMQELNRMIHEKERNIKQKYVFSEDEKEL